MALQVGMDLSFKRHEPEGIRDYVLGRIIKNFPEQSLSVQRKVQIVQQEVTINRVHKNDLANALISIVLNLLPSNPSRTNAVVRTRTWTTSKIPRRTRG